MLVVVWCLAVAFGAARAVQQDEWQGILSPRAFVNVKTFDSAGIFGHHFHPGSPATTSGQCSLHKVAFTQDLYFQYVQYKTHVPELKEFTLCFWSKFTNHTNDHPIFSYAVDGQPRAIYSWISNTERSSYYSLAVEGHTFFRLNYPLRLNKWYHTCQSWNGRTGEWQIWVDAERVGRGFHNRLVGHSVPANGLAITGQEQTQLGGGFSEGPDAPRGAGGMLGEVTMVQLYAVALTAGKAHRDHKHHHAHQYDHNGNQITTPAPSTPAPRPPLPAHPLLTSGQINPSLMLNFAGGQSPQPQIIPGQSYNAQLLNGQFVGNLVSEQLSAGRGVQQFRQQPVQLLAGAQAAAPLINSGLVHPALVNPANVQFIDSAPLNAHQLFKRDHSAAAATTAKPPPGRRVVKRQPQYGDKIKRELFVGGGHFLDEGLVSAPLEQGSVQLDGLAGIGQNEPILEQQKQYDEREPAEAEVKAVMNVCSNCDEEPFAKALVFGWRTVPKKLYSGAFYVAAVPQCKVF